MKKGAATRERIAQQVLCLLSDVHLRMTPSDLVRTLANHFPGVDRRVFRTCIQEMVNAGTLTYSHHFSSSHIELGSGGQRPVSTRLSLEPVFYPRRQKPALLNLSIQNGSAFGRGDHPTTRLALEAIDWVSGRCLTDTHAAIPVVLDIGTGTGVLAMAAALLGMGPAIGIDIDLPACCEAVENVRSNGLVGIVHIVAGDLNAIKQIPFGLILANLRPPTLVRLIPMMVQRTMENGYWVVTGCRPDETEGVLCRLPPSFRQVWSRNNRNWAAVVVQRI